VFFSVNENENKTKNKKNYRTIQTADGVYLVTMHCEVKIDAVYRKRS